jgi:AcrR family transcriptional regulator
MNMSGSHYHCSAETQRKLVDAVVHLARGKSYDNITVQEICTVAGVSTGSFYHQFRSKDELVHEAYQSIDWLLTKEFIAQYSRLPPLQALDCLLRRYISYIQDTIGLIIGQYYQVLLKNPFAPRYDSNRPYCREIRRILTDAIDQKLITNRFDPEYLTWSTMRLVRGLLFDWVIQGGRYDLVERYQVDYEIFIGGLAGSILHDGRNTAPSA